MAKAKSYVSAGGGSAAKSGSTTPGPSARDAQMRAQSPAGQSFPAGGQKAAGNTNPFVARQQAQSNAAWQAAPMRTVDNDSKARYTGKTAYTGADGRMTSPGAFPNPAPSAFVAPSSAASGGAWQPDVSLTSRRLSELLQRRAELEAEKEAKQAALDEAKRDADAALRNPFLERQHDELQNAFATLQANMAKNAAKKSAAGTPYHFLPVQQPRLVAPNPDEDWTKRANIKNLSEDSKTLVGLIALLPENFPIDDFDTMLPKQQLAAVQRTDLTREEQWALLNAKVDVKALSKVMDVQENRLYYGLSQAQADAICQQLLDIDNARIGTRNHAVPLTTERQRQAFLKLLDEEEAALLEALNGRARSGGGSSIRPVQVKDMYDTIKTNKPVYNPVDNEQSGDSFAADYQELGKATYEHTEYPVNRSGRSTGIRINVDEYYDELYPLAKRIGLDATSKIMADIACEGYKEEWGKAFLFTNECVAREIKHHLGAYIDVVSGDDLGRDWTTYVYPHNKILDMCSSIEIDIINPKGQIPQNWYYGYSSSIRDEYYGTDADPYDAHKSKGGRS